MEKEELLEKIDSLIKEAEISEDNANTDLDRMFYIGKQNGLLWAKFYIIDLRIK